MFSLKLKHVFMIINSIKNEDNMTFLYCLLKAESIFGDIHSKSQDPSHISPSKLWNFIVKNNEKQYH